MMTGLEELLHLSLSGLGGDVVGLLRALNDEGGSLSPPLHDAVSPGGGGLLVLALSITFLIVFCVYLIWVVYKLATKHHHRANYNATFTA